jgi:ribosomal protein S12 methylthiotransferase accessory factor
MGITRIANVTGLDCIGIPVVMVCRPNSRGLAVSQGKGLDLDAARASGLMESIEGYHAEHITLPLKLCSYEELRYAHRVVDVLQLPRPRDAVFDPFQPLLWIEGHDLIQDEAVWIPYELAHTNYTLASWSGRGTFAASSNGLAAGNHILETVSHGICEVVERDAVTLWGLKSADARRMTRVDLSTVDDPGCLAVLEKLDRAGVGVAVWDITSDAQIPAFQCAIVQRSENDLRRLPAALGTGCAPSRAVALLRALTEAIQSRLTAITGSRDDMSWVMYDASRDDDAFAAQRRLILAESGNRPFGGMSRDGDTFDEDVAWELGRLRAAGIERVVVVNLTKPELSVPVVRVVIPGLEPSHQHAACAHGPRARAVIENRA